MLTRMALAFLIATGWLILGGAGSVAGAPGVAAERPEFVPDEVLVKLTEAVPPGQIEELNQELKSQVLHYFGFIRLHRLRLPEGLSVENALRIIREKPYVEYAEPNYLRYLDQTVPDDPRFGEMWGLNNIGQSGGVADADIDAPEAWDITTGSPNVVIAVIDSGLDLDHVDIAANLWTAAGEIAGNGLDDDGNGFIDDVHGWDFSSDDNDPSPAGGACLGHGTHTAGTIGAVGNNGVGVVGVNWNVKIMPLKAFRVVLGILCSASDADLIAAIEYQTIMGIRISSNSWGGPSPSQAMSDAIRASDSVFVAAAGNGGLDGVGDNNDVRPNYPSNYPLDNIIAVAATDRNDALAGFSNFGLTTVDLGAPGVAVLSTLPDDSYGLFSGTSMATPHVAGVAGLLLAQDPGLTNNEIKWRILHSVDLTGLPILSGGRLNARDALELGLTTPAVTVEVTPLGSTEVSPGSRVRLDLSLTNHLGSPIDLTFKAYILMQDGRVISTAPTAVTLGPNETVSRTVSRRLPVTVPPGTMFRVFGQAETAQSFDEDWDGYTVVP